MLNRLYVKNIALISEAEIKFVSGLNVLSGETGSGKSVILDSINFVLGSKADRTMIRFGENEALVKAEFSVPKSSEAVKILEGYDIECDGDIIISRKMNSEGKGAIKVNGNAVTLSMLKNLTQHLVDVHGQSEHFFLLNEDNQLKVIDGLLGEEAEKIKEELSGLLSKQRQLKGKIAEFGGGESERARKLDLLDFQINEIEAADLKIGEFEELKSKQNIILNVEKLLSCLNAAKCILSDDGGVSDGLYSAMREVGRISELGEDYSNLYSRMESAGAEISDISEVLSDLSDNLSFDENEAQFVEARLNLIKNLRKKYGADEESIIAFGARAKEEYNAIADGAALIEKYEKEIAACSEELLKLSLKLSALRKKAADSFCFRVVEQLKSLNIPDAKFAVRFTERENCGKTVCTANGCDEICFEFSANKGEPLKPLNKVISGGEMSRFMLAIKTQLKDLNGISTYIFDEIDAGISGYTAVKVAEKFIDISKTTQILAVSHLPQVCAASDGQFLIYKVEESGKTLTKVKSLTFEEKIEEIVRLTGSVNSEAARLHAEELLKQFKKV